MAILKRLGGGGPTNSTQVRRGSQVRRLSSTGEIFENRTLSVWRPAFFSAPVFFSARLDSPAELTLPYAQEKHILLPFLPVDVEIRPGCPTNWIALGGPGTVTVVAGTADEVVTASGPLAVKRLEGTGWVALAVEGTPSCHRASG